MKQTNGQAENPGRRHGLRWRRWVLLLFLMALGWLYFHLPQGTGFLGMLASALENMVTPNKQTSEKKPSESPTSVQLRLSFSGDKTTLYLGNWQCASKPLQKNLKELIPLIRRHYPQQQIIVEYVENKGDAYFLTKEVEQILKDNGFLFDWKNKHE